MELYELIRLFSRVTFLKIISYFTGTAEKTKIFAQFAKRAEMRRFHELLQLFSII